MILDFPDISWSDVGGAVAKAAPLLGGLLGGPAGATVGGLISAAFGCDSTPDAIHKAVAADPEAAVKLAQIEADNRVQLQQLVVTAEQNRLAAETAQLQSVNATMQAEAVSEHWLQWSWRPLWGIISAVTFGVVCVYVLYLLHIAIVGKQPDAMASIPNVISSMVLLFGVPGAILGVASWKRGTMKIAQVQAGAVKAGTA